MAAPNRFFILEVFRGIAALFVVFHHALVSIEYYHNYTTPFLKFICHIGKYGVDFFFVLSGFIITYSYSETTSNNFQGLKRFLKLRCIRIYTPFVPISIFLLLLYHFFPTISNASKNIDLVTSLTLIPLGKPALTVAWTLSHEMLFYLIFSLRFLLPKYWNTLIICWVSLIVCHYLFFDFSSHSMIQVLVSPYNLEFIFGCWVAHLFLTNRMFSIKQMGSILCLCLVVFFYIVANGYYEVPFLSNFVFMLFCGLLIQWSLVKQLQPVKSVIYVGTISYSIYLIHNPLQVIIVRFFPKFHSELSLIFLLTLIVFFVLLFSGFYYQIFEKKLTNFFKRIWIS